MSAATVREERALRREIGRIVPGIFGGFGARFSSRFLPIYTHEESIEIPHDHSEEPLAYVQDCLRDHARFTEEFQADQTEDTISLFVGSGSMNLNPTIVHISAVARTAEGSIVRLCARAKEGLIKQNSAMKAIERIKDLLALGISK